MTMTCAFAVEAINWMQILLHESTNTPRLRDVDLCVAALDRALDQLEKERPDLAELVSLRYFAGLTMDQAAKSLGISKRTAERNWTYARGWLLQAIQQSANFQKDRGFNTPPDAHRRRAAQEERMA